MLDIWESFSKTILRQQNPQRKCPDICNVSHEGEEFWWKFKGRTIIRKAKPLTQYFIRLELECFQENQVRFDGPECSHVSSQKETYAPSAR